MHCAYKVSIGSFDAITNNRNNAVERLSFDAWGRRRNATDWTYNNVTTSFLFDRGFTGHEHMDAFGLINANGRIYDPCMGRFLSPDIVVQSPDFTQDYNRYSYAINNPLKYSDPSGYTRPPAFETYWNEYVGLMQQGYERRLVADENAWLFFQWYVKEVNGKWIRRENAMDVTGKGDYVSRDEIIRFEGKNAVAFVINVIKLYLSDENAPLFAVINGSYDFQQNNEKINLTVLTEHEKVIAIIMFIKNGIDKMNRTGNSIACLSDFFDKGNYFGSITATSQIRINGQLIKVTVTLNLFTEKALDCIDFSYGGTENTLGSYNNTYNEIFDFYYVDRKYLRAASITVSQKYSNDILKFLYGD